MAAACPPSSFRYNGTLCACYPGMYMSSTPHGGSGARECVLFDEGEWRAGSSSGVAVRGLAPGPGALLGEVLPLETVERVVSSEAVVVKATLVLVLFWLAFCLGVRFGRVDGGRTAWFRVRCWIARLDHRFSTKHHVVSILYCTLQAVKLFVSR